jgi:hypothetical protein
VAFSALVRGESQGEKAGEGRREVTEASLAIARKIVLYTGLLVAWLLLAYPHWNLVYSADEGVTFVSQDLGRSFITAPPVPFAKPIASSWVEDKKPIRINYVRQFTEVAIALAFTFAVMSALRKPAEDRKHNENRPEIS